MSAILLCHLGESVPHYLRDCVHQIRIFNPSLPVYLILEPLQLKNPFYTSLADSYSLCLVSTESLEPTEHHLFFRNGIKHDASFRKGFWRHVKERFYYFEELILRENLSNVICMEYDILVYLPLEPLLHKLAGLPAEQQTLRIVMDNQTRGHPGFMIIPSWAAMTHLNKFATTLLAQVHTMDDMQILCLYSKLCPGRVNFLPCISEKTNQTKSERKSLDGQIKCTDCHFLSQGASYFGCLFDSAVVGQFVGGIDSRNTGGQKVSQYLNEGALYQITETTFGWAKSPQGWIPVFDGFPLATIHCHSKALSCFLSDRKDPPTDDYDVKELFAKLLPN